jgi:hypothetical protein
VPVLEAPRLGRQPKQTIVKNSNICRLTNEYKGYIHLLAVEYMGNVSTRAWPWAPYIRWLNDEYRVPCVSPRAAAPHPSMFVGDVASTNVAPYNIRCHITDEFKINSSVPMNMLGYICRRIHRLTHKFMYIHQFHYYICWFKPMNLLLFLVVCVLAVRETTSELEMQDLDHAHIC